MSKITVTAPTAPPAVGPYSHAVIANGFIFTAGQVGLIPGTKSLVEGGIEAQTTQALENVKAVLQASGSGLEKVVKATVFLANMDDFAAMNAVYAKYFWRSQPARSAVQVARLPLGALVEIETIALV
ncbi:MAG: Rid family detoxifying hydrolase [Anaerolineae bacterium]|jgi:2-iminobutanoate/2-iminopropanoate deaminase|nr:Rid family detoxifying hydrolase [Anaerolineae bacterium]